MRRTLPILVAGGFLAATAACGSSADSRSAAAPPAVPSTASPTVPPAAPSAGGPAAVGAPPEETDAAAALGKLATAVPSLKIVKQYTAEDDPNHLLGRPGQYVSKVSFSDSRIKPADVEGESADSVARGGAVEVFATEADARKRSEYIQAIVKGMPALLEYDYVRGPVLIRVSKYLTPDQAKALQSAV
ncbi:hypothetical protein ACIRS1_01560 [Kitasatospora sp. NPDC101176]|uniref:hypothetical protein n=1 Tax=Kitasatospora sp. NPDC101176 TaxID=3364099 RepID=UPI00381C3ACD